MPTPPAHRTIAADVHAVPKPFTAFAVRSDEPLHATQARAPYGRVHAVRTGFLDGAALARLAAAGRARVNIKAFSDIDHAATTLDDLAATVPGVADLAGGIAGALQRTGVLGDGPTAYRASVATRIDYLAACGAGFHNDVSDHWPRCLFWLLALQVDDVEFVMPHAGVRLPVAAGDLVVFDQTMAHGLCRAADGGQALESSFRPGEHQIFLTGELLLSDAQWAALGAPWLPVDDPAHCGALDLRVAEFDDRSGGIKCLRAMRGCMQRNASDGAD